MELLDKTYSAGEVSTAAAVATPTVADWASKGFIAGQREPLGRGRRRAFSWSNIIEIAGAAALMDIGVRSPTDAFRAAVRFSHAGSSHGGWIDDAGTAHEHDPSPLRLPGLPYPIQQGLTFLLVAGDQSAVILIDRKTSFLDALVKLKGMSPTRPSGFIALDMTRTFLLVTERLGLDGHEILKTAYNGGDAS